jgi:Domain of unknown function (DUF4395)
MIPENSLSCPVDFVSVNENKIRIIAFHVFMLSIVILFKPHWVSIGLLAVDFFLRTFKLNKFSPFAISAAGMTKVLTLGFKPVDQGPKRFAAGVGLAFSLAMLATYFTSYTTATLILTATITVFSFLESFLAFCAGCYVYTFLVRVFKTTKIIASVCGSRSENIQSTTRAHSSLKIDR